MELDLNLTYLKFFHDAALSGSVSESAKRNFVTQSAVSQAISKLERSLDVSLCLHKKQKFKLTEEGKLVFNHAKNIFSSVRNLHDALDHYQKQPRMPLNFVSSHSIGLSLLPSFMPIFQSDYPEISLNFHFGGLSQIRGWLRQGIAEFALVLGSAEFSEYNAIPIYSGSFTLFKHKKEKAIPKNCGIYVENQDGMLVEEFQRQYMKLNGNQLPIKTQLNSWELIARCLQNGGGYGFLPDFVLFDSRYPELVPVKKDIPTIPYNVCVVSLKGEKLSYSAQTFIDDLISHLRK